MKEYICALRVKTNERNVFMILINDTEKKIIAAAMPDIHIRRTVKQKSKRHKYYMEESRDAMQLLNSIREAYKPKAVLH
jgi:hypothetical protein